MKKIVYAFLMMAFLWAPVSGSASVQSHRQLVQYYAQQRAIRAMAEALYMKKALDILGSVDRDHAKSISNQYQNARSTLATVIARRGLYNSLLTFKYQIAGVRARLRAEAAEVDLLPVAEAPVVVTTTTTSGVTPGVVTTQ